VKIPESPKSAITEKDVSLWSDLAYRLVQAGRYEEARRIAEGIVALRPDYYFGHALAGALADRCGDRENARRSYQRAVRYNPADAASLLNLGRLRISAGEVERGLEEVRRAWLLARRKHPDVERMARAVLDCYEA
jgi:tetratricopeptide (TPR) repeat protein